jgi:hypothetical protein
LVEKTGVAPEMNSNGVTDFLRAGFTRLPSSSARCGLCSFVEGEAPEFVGVGD